MEDDADNTERNQNEEIHLNNSEFIIIDKAQYARDQKQAEAIQEIEYQEKVLIDDSFSRKKNIEVIEQNYISPVNYNVKIEETE